MAPKDKQQSKSEKAAEDEKEQVVEPMIQPDAAMSDDEQFDFANISWAGLAEEIETGSQLSDFFFPKGSVTVVHLAWDRSVHPRDNGGRPKILQPVTFSSKFGTKTKFIVFGQVLSSNFGDGTLHDRWKNKIVPIILPKQMIKVIQSYLGEGLRIVGPKAMAVKLLKSGTGLKTQWSMMQSREHEFAIDVEWPSHTLEEYAIMYKQAQEANAGNSLAKADNSSDDAAAEQESW
jgi:hypothetical protein